MAKLRKLVGWLPAVGAMIFNGCVIGWLHCTKPQLLGPAVSGGAIASVYGTYKGIQQYFVKEGRGRELEKELVKGGLAKVSVDKNGNARIKEIITAK